MEKVVKAVKNVAKDFGQAAGSAFETWDEKFRQWEQGDGDSLPGTQAARAHTAPTVRLIPKPFPKQPGEMLGYTVILETHEAVRSNYYLVRARRCPNQHETPGVTGQNCPQCGLPLLLSLVRETVSRVRLDESTQNSMNLLSRAGAGRVLPIQRVHYVDNVQYLYLDPPPGPWQTLKELALPVPDPDQVVTWALFLGETLAWLHAQQYSWAGEPQGNFLDSLVFVDTKTVLLTDVNICKPLSVQHRLSDVQRDLSYFGRLLYALSTGIGRGKHGEDTLREVPAVFRRIVARARQTEYDSLSAFLDDLKKAPAQPAFKRSLRQIAGYATNMGKTRDHNEDFVGRYSFGMEQLPSDLEVGLYIVADGMGGHQAGELASREVVRVVTERIHTLKAAPRLKRATVRLDQADTNEDALRQAILEGNQILLTARQAVGSDRGTTITAALIVGASCAVANVGDSRTYLYRNGKLEQISQDHSLVASLVAAKMIRPDEVRSHPQRNQIFRTLGDKPNVEVDTFPLELEAGDQLLLCSDGLWEMVLDADIERIVRAAADPQDACDRLIEAANAAGGEDNISAVVIWLR
jgi:protein phosphatase